ncbi:MAG: hypothetical protein J0665_12005 [Deltaproteobacteria bacterium]|nr:hypothetical protein [Deltaproteobacteria bacterium]
MGTRSLTVFTDEEGTEIGVMYRQLDGYPEGHGKELAEMLSGIRMVNGLPIRNPGKVANGMGCLAAQIVAHFKDGAGGIYLFPAGSRNCGEDYTYLVTGDTNVPEIEIHDRSKMLYKGKASDYELLLGANQASN